MVFIVLEAIWVPVSEYFGNLLHFMSKACECNTLILLVGILFRVILVSYNVGLFKSSCIYLFILYWFCCSMCVGVFISCAFVGLFRSIFFEAVNQTTDG
jgi:hypothetical protein